MAPNVLSGERITPPRKQRGIVLVVALIALVAMTLAAMALVRSIDTGVTIAGNMAFKSATTASADIAIEDAGTWLHSIAMNWIDLNTDKTSGGYYATWRTGCDMTGNETPNDKTDDMQWDPLENANSKCGAKAVAMQMPADMPSGYTGTYVVTRLCTCEGTPGANVCSGSETNICAGFEGSTPEKHGGNYNYLGLSGSQQGQLQTDSPYYRVISRVVGPRNTISFVESIVTFSE